MKQRQTVMRILPQRLQAALAQIDAAAVDELRLRVGRPPVYTHAHTEYPLFLPDEKNNVSGAELEEIVMSACGCSVYSVQSQLAAGYLILPGGHRIGICGTLVQESGRILTVREISSLCIRFAREIRTDVSPLRKALEEDLLIIGAPGSGKTTLLRNCIRQISESGRRISVADERGEIAAAFSGKPQFDLGPCTDVMTGGKKSESMMLLLRSMTPAVLAVDEITAPEDVEAIRQAGYCGVRLLATAHAQSLDEFNGREVYRSLLKLGIFRRAVLLRPDRTFCLKELVGC